MDMLIAAIVVLVLALAVAQFFLTAEPSNGPARDDGAQAGPARPPNGRRGAVNPSVGQKIAAIPAIPAPMGGDEKSGGGGA